MAEPKTKPTSASVAAHLQSISDEGRRKDAKALATLLAKATGERPVMWGSSIVGFGVHRYPGSRGRSAEWPVIAFSARSSALVLHITVGLDHHAELLVKLGRHKAGKGCLYIGSLADVDLRVLQQIVEKSVRAIGRAGTDQAVRTN